MVMRPPNTNQIKYWEFCQMDVFVSQYKVIYTHCGSGMKGEDFRWWGKGGRGYQKLVPGLVWEDRMNYNNDEIYLKHIYVILYK